MFPIPDYSVLTNTVTTRGDSVLISAFVLYLMMNSPSPSFCVDTCECSSSCCLYLVSYVYPLTPTWAHTSAVVNERRTCSSPLKTALGWSRYRLGYNYSNVKVHKVRNQSRSKYPDCFYPPRFFVLKSAI